MITVSIKLDCYGCDATAEASVKARRMFASMTGKDHGLGSYHLDMSLEDAITAATPNGWVAFDPYTQVTYCAKCWDEICAE